MSIESDANKDLSLSEEDAEGVAGGKVQSIKKQKHPAPTETNVEVSASGGGWQPVVDDPSEDC